MNLAKEATFFWILILLLTGVFFVAGYYQGLEDGKEEAFQESKFPKFPIPGQPQVGLESAPSGFWVVSSGSLYVYDRDKNWIEVCKPCPVEVEQ